MAVAIVAAACSSLEPEDPPARARAAVVQDVGAMLAQAESAYAKLEWARAAVLYAELVKRDTANADYWFKLGNSEARAGNSERAVAALTRAARLEPEMSKAWFNLSVVELRRARQALEALLQNAAADDAHSARADALLERLTAVLDELRQAQSNAQD